MTASVDSGAFAFGLFIGVLFWIVLGAAVGHAIGQPKGRGTDGAWLGGLLGVIGWIIIAVMSPTPEAEVERLNQIERLRQAQHPGGATSPAHVAASGPAAAATLEPAAWAPDPTSRHQHRYFNGREWTDQVSDSGTVTTDPMFPVPQGNGWDPDPFGRYEMRWHRNGAWTASVATKGVTATDPPTFPPPSALAPPPPPPAPPTAAG